MFGRVGSERWVGAAWGTLFTSILAILIVVGSRNLQHFDAALVGYTFAVLFATFAITYRYAMWLLRPPTKRYWNRGQLVSAGHGGLCVQPIHLQAESEPRRGALFHHVGLRPGVRDHVPARLRLDSFRDAAG
jgi:hypothetical protein